MANIRGLFKITRTRLILKCRLYYFIFNRKVVNGDFFKLPAELFLQLPSLKKTLSSIHEGMHNKMCKVVWLICFFWQQCPIRVFCPSSQYSWVHQCNHLHVSQWDIKQHYLIFKTRAQKIYFRMFNLLTVFCHICAFKAISFKLCS